MVSGGDGGGCFLGSGPDRGQRSVEWGIFCLFSCTFVCPSSQPKQGLGPVNQAGSCTRQPSSWASQSALGASQPGLKANQPGLSQSQRAREPESAQGGRTEKHPILYNLVHYHDHYSASLKNTLKNYIFGNLSKAEQGNC